MRTLDLIKSLPEKELKLIEHELVSGKRKTLVPLFKELKKCRQKELKPDRSELYKKVFGTAYTKGKDYLLRNELRLLNDVIYGYLVVDCFKEHAGKNKSLFNRWLAQSYHNRRMPVFAEDINGFILEAKRNIQTEEATLMYALRSSWASLFPAGPVEKMQEQLDEWKQEEMRRFLHHLRKIEYAGVFYQNRVLQKKALSPDRGDDWTTKGETKIDLGDIEKNDWYTRYLTLQKYYWQSKGDTQLKYLQELIELTGNEQARNVIRPRERITSIEAMAFSLFMSGRHQQAEVYMEEPLRLYQQHHLPVSPAHVVVYMFNLLLTDRFQQAINLYKSYSGITDISASRGHAILAQAYAYLFMHKPDEALQMISPVPALDPNEVIHIRYIYMLSFLLRKQYDLALAELKNLKRTLSTSTLAGKESDLTIAGYFQTYLRALQQTKAVRKSQMAELSNEVNANFKNLKPTPYANLQLNWLVRELVGEG